MAGLYVHIPFCASRCIYCGFYSTTLGTAWKGRYVNALCREMQLREKPAIGTIYIGGGTPSVLTEEHLTTLFAHIGDTYGAEAAEVTMEVNPDDVTEDFADMLRRLPVNRVSMGAQTFSDARLRFLHRRHEARQVAQAVERLRKAGLRNISIDLMFGFPGETLSDWRDDLDQALHLSPEHLSAYSLTYEEGTPLYARKDESRYRPIDEELSRQMYELLIERMTAEGYEHYEISNFARPGFRARHNAGYWNETPYIGIGAAAHSFDGGTRSWNVADVKAYVEAIEQGRRPSEQETIDRDTRYNDLVATALRTREGISLATLPEDQRSYLRENARRHITAGTLCEEDGFLRLTREGLYVSDGIMSDLVIVERGE